jgi:putative membrane protein (TIGR04086 family)
MRIHWFAVINGFVAYAVCFTLLLWVFDPVALQFADRQDWLQYSLFSCLAVSLGGYIAGRMAGTQHGMHGVLVGLLAVIFSNVQAWASYDWSFSRMEVVVLAFACLLSWCGGVLGRFGKSDNKVK